MKYLSLIIPGPSGPVTVQTPPSVPGDATVLGHVPQFAITLLISLVIVASVAMIIYSGIQWIMSGGDAKKIDGARNRLTYAIIGLAVSIMAVVIVSFTIQILGGNPDFFNLSNNKTETQFKQRVTRGNADATPNPKQHCFIILGKNICR